MFKVGSDKVLFFFLNNQLVIKERSHFPARGTVIISNF